MVATLFPLWWVESMNECKPVASVSCLQLGLWLVLGCGIGLGTEANAQPREKPGSAGAPGAIDPALLEMNIPSSPVPRLDARLWELLIVQNSVKRDDDVASVPDPNVEVQFAEWLSRDRQAYSAAEGVLRRLIDREESRGGGLVPPRRPALPSVADDPVVAHDLWQYMLEHPYPLVPHARNLLAECLIAKGKLRKAEEQLRMNRQFFAAHEATQEASPDGMASAVQLSSSYGRLEIAQHFLLGHPDKRAWLLTLVVHRLTNAAELCAEDRRQITRHWPRFSAVLLEQAEQMVREIEKNRQAKEK